MLALSVWSDGVLFSMTRHILVFLSPLPEQSQTKEELEAARYIRSYTRRKWCAAWCTMLRHNIFACARDTREGVRKPRCQSAARSGPYPDLDNYCSFGDGSGPPRRLSENTIGTVNTPVMALSDRLKATGSRAGGWGSIASSAWAGTSASAVERRGPAFEGDIEAGAAAADLAPAILAPERGLKASSGGVDIGKHSSSGRELMHQGKASSDRDVDGDLFPPHAEQLTMSTAAREISILEDAVLHSTGTWTSEHGGSLVEDHSGASGRGLITGDVLLNVAGTSGGGDLGHMTAPSGPGLRRRALVPRLRRAPLEDDLPRRGGASSEVGLSSERDMSSSLQYLLDDPRKANGDGGNGNRGGSSSAGEASSGRQLMHRGASNEEQRDMPTRLPSSLGRSMYNSANADVLDADSTAASVYASRGAHDLLDGGVEDGGQWESGKCHESTDIVAGGKRRRQSIPDMIGWGGSRGPTEDSLPRRRLSSSVDKSFPGHHLSISSSDELAASSCQSRKEGRAEVKPSDEAAVPDDKLREEQHERNGSGKARRHGLLSNVASWVSQRPTETDLPRRRLSLVETSSGRCGSADTEESSEKASESLRVASVGRNEQGFKALGDQSRVDETENEYRRGLLSRNTASGFALLPWGSQNPTESQLPRRRSVISMSSSGAPVGDSYVDGMASSSVVGAAEFDVERRGNENKGQGYATRRKSKSQRLDSEGCIGQHVSSQPRTIHGSIAALDASWKFAPSAVDIPRRGTMFSAGTSRSETGERSDRDGGSGEEGGDFTTAVSTGESNVEVEVINACEKGGEENDRTHGEFERTVAVGERGNNLGPSDARHLSRNSSISGGDGGSVYGVLRGLTRNKAPIADDLPRRSSGVSALPSYPSTSASTSLSLRSLWRTFSEHFHSVGTEGGQHSTTTDDSSRWAPSSSVPTAAISTINRNDSRRRGVSASHGSAGITGEQFQSDLSRDFSIESIVPEGGVEVPGQKDDGQSTEGGNDSRSRRSDSSSSSFTGKGVRSEGYFRHSQHEVEGRSLSGVVSKNDLPPRRAIGHFGSDKVISADSNQDTRRDVIELATSEGESRGTGYDEFQQGPESEDHDDGYEKYEEARAESETYDDGYDEFVEAGAESEVHDGYESDYTVFSGGTIPS